MTTRFVFLLDFLGFFSQANYLVSRQQLIFRETTWKDKTITSRWSERKMRKLLTDEDSDTETFFFNDFFNSESNFFNVLLGTQSKKCVDVLKNDE